MPFYEMIQREQYERYPHRRRCCANPGERDDSEAERQHADRNEARGCANPA
jgi:hypothetical protein